MWAHAVDLPRGADPSLLLQQHGPAGLLAALQSARGRPLADLVVAERVDRHSGQLQWVEGQLAAGRAAAVVIATLPAEHVGRQVTRLAARLDLPIATVNELVLDAVTDSQNGAAAPFRAEALSLNGADGRAAPALGQAVQLAQAGFPVPLSRSLRAASEVAYARPPAPVASQRPVRRHA